MDMLRDFIIEVEVDCYGTPGDVPTRLLRGTYLSHYLQITRGTAVVLQELTFVSHFHFIKVSCLCFHHNTSNIGILNTNQRSHAFSFGR